MENNLLQTKLFVPPPRKNRVKRPRLTNKIVEAFSGGQQMVVVSASAGYGKSSLLAEWATETELPIAWVSLDAQDNNPVNLMAYIIASLERVGVQAGSKIKNTLKLQKDPPPRKLFQALSNDIVRHGEDFVLILDDFHVLTNEELLPGICEFIGDLPPQMHLILSGRSMPRIPCEKLVASGSTTMIEERDLRFLREEAAQFFDQSFEAHLSQEELLLVEERTEGWVTALQMIGIALQNRTDSEAFFRSFAEAEQGIQQYLMGEVLSEQAEEIRAFLAQTAVLDRFSVPLVNHMLGADTAQDTLQEMIHKKLFVIPLDEKGQWYRYHHLFAELLKDRYLAEDKEEMRKLHGKAAQWFRGEDHVAEAIGHAIQADDHAQAAELIDNSMEQYWQVGEAHQIMGWINALPEEVFHKNPNIRLFFSWFQFQRGKIKEGLASLKRIEVCLAEHDCLAHLSQSQRKRIEAILASQRAAYESTFGSPQQAIKLADHSLELHQTKTGLWIGTAWNAKGMAYRTMGECKQAIGALNRAVATHGKIANFYGLMVSYSSLAIQYHQMGQLAKVYETCQEALADIRRADERFIPVGVIYLQLGKVLIEWAEFDEAESFLLDSIDIFIEDNDLEYLMEAYYQLACLRQIQKSQTEAEEIMLQAATIISERTPPMLLAVRFRAYQARILALGGEVNRAAMLVNMMDLSETDQERFNKAKKDLFAGRTTAYVVASNPWGHRLAFERLTQAMLLIHQGFPGEALQILDELENSFESSYCNMYRLESMLLRAWAQAENGDARASKGLLLEALKGSQKGNYVSSYLQFGQRMKAWLDGLAEKIQQDGKPAAGVTNDIDTVLYINKLRAGFSLTGKGHNNTSNGYKIAAIQLTRREEEVLQLLAKGLSYQEIAQRLTVTENTVRTHIRGLYGKLDVNNRVLAITKANKVGLLT